jgi:hypothetical protein
MSLLLYFLGHRTYSDPAIPASRSLTPSRNITAVRHGISWPYSGPEFDRLASLFREASADREQVGCGARCLPRMMSNIPGFLAESI